jgi:hypothetical protein
MAENLDALKCGGWGVFIAPTTKRTVGEGFCRMAHRTVRCASHPAIRVRPLELLTSGPPDSNYSLSGAPSAPALTSAHAVVHCSVANDHWRGRPLLCLAHRTVRCYTGQSGEL